MNVARQLLRETKMSVMDVALEVATPTPAISRNSSAEKPASPRATTAACVNLRPDADSHAEPTPSVRIARVSAWAYREAFVEGYCELYREQRAH